MAKFLVYDLVDPRDGKPFYVGKGSGRRPYEHITEATTGGESAKCDRIREILAVGLSVKVEIVQRFKDEADAFAFEAERIAELGPETLTNMCAGGYGGWSSRRKPRAAKYSARLTEAAINCFIKLASFKAAGYKVWFGKLELTAFSEDCLRRHISAVGLGPVQEQFSEHGVLLTGPNNAVC